MEESKKDFYDVEFISQQKAINDVLIRNNVFSNELIFNYVTSRDTGIAAGELDSKIKNTLYSCGIKDFAMNDCRNHLELLKKSFASPENEKFFNALSKDKDYSIELLSDGALEIIEIDKNRKETLSKQIDENKKKIGVVNGGLITNFLHHWKVSSKLAALFLEKHFSPDKHASIIHQGEIKIEELDKFVGKLNNLLESTEGKQYLIQAADIHKLNSLGINYEKISKDDWIKIVKGEIAGPVDMVIGNVSTPVLLTIKDDHLGAYHLNDVSKKEMLAMANSEHKDLHNELSKEKNIKQEIGNYLFNTFGILTLGFSNEDFELLKNGQLSNAIMRSPNANIFGLDDKDNRMGKIRLQFDEGGKISGHEVLPRVAKLEINDFFKGNFLLPDMKESLSEIGEFEQAVYLNIDGRDNVKGFLSVDNSLNQVVFLEVDKISIPQKINGQEIKEDFKHDLLEGRSVLFFDLRHEGEDIDAIVKLNKKTGQLEVEKMSDYAERLENQETNEQKESIKVLEIPKKFMGYEFSSKDLITLEQKGGLKDAVKVEKDGELVEGFISVDKTKQEVVFLAKSEILIDQRALNGNKLSKEQRQMLVNGYEVVYSNFVNEGNKSTVKIEINRLDGSTKVRPVVSGKKALEEKIEKAAKEKQSKSETKSNSPSNFL